jgi:POT family proton-dependent oligopeptide transporter
MHWLVLAYLFHTIGELCSSPVALSFITKLAPVKYASLMMGVYFAATGLGNKVAGILGENASEYGEYAIFSGIVIFTVIFGILVIALLKPLNRLTHGAEENEHEVSH